MTAFYWSMAYRKSTLVDEQDILVLAKDMPTKRTLRTRLSKIDYLDMQKAVEKTFKNDYSYSCHGDIFEITRHNEAQV